MRPTVYAMIALNTLVWGGFALMGVDLLLAKHVPGYPNGGQIIYYLGFPLGMLTIALILSILALRFGHGGIAIVVLLAALAPLPFYFLSYFGGI